MTPAEAQHVPVADAVPADACITCTATAGCSRRTTCTTAGSTISTGIPSSIRRSRRRGDAALNLPALFQTHAWIGPAAVRGRAALCFARWPDVSGKVLPPSARYRRPRAAADLRRQLRREPCVGPLCSWASSWTGGSSPTCGAISPRRARRSRRSAAPPRSCARPATSRPRTRKYTLRTLPPAPKPKPAWQQGLDELLLSAVIDDLATQADADRQARRDAGRARAALPVARGAPCGREDAEAAAGARWPAPRPRATRSAPGGPARRRSTRGRCGRARSRRSSTISCARSMSPPATPRPRSPPPSTPRRPTATSIAAAASPGSCATIFPSARRRRSSRRSATRNSAATRRSSRCRPMRPIWPGASAGRAGRQGLALGRPQRAGERDGAARGRAQARRRAAGRLPPTSSRRRSAPSCWSASTTASPPCASSRPASSPSSATPCSASSPAPTSRRSREAYFRAQYGVSLRHLVPIAEPTNLSCSIVLHLGKGERFGWCFLWDHEARLGAGTRPAELRGRADRADHRHRAARRLRAAVPRDRGLATSRKMIRHARACAGSTPLDVSPQEGSGWPRVMARP